MARTEHKQHKLITYYTAQPQFTALSSLDYVIGLETNRIYRTKL